MHFDEIIKDMKLGKFQVESILYHLRGGGGDYEFKFFFNS